MNIVEEIEKQISDLNKKLVSIQNACVHPSECLTHKYGSNTGNYDPSDDCYWTDFHCQLCGKKWTESGSHSVPKLKSQG